MHKLEFNNNMLSPLFHFFTSVDVCVYKVTLWMNQNDFLLQQDMTKKHLQNQLTSFIFNFTATR